MGFAVPHFEMVAHDIDERTVVLAVQGEIHVSTAPRFSQEFNDAIDRGHELVVLDLTLVEFIDSTGLSVLLAGLRSVSLRHGRLALALTNPTVLRLFSITRLDETFDIVATREQALERVRA
ncbi:MAG: STAS domain-containing protein [Solirubrobacterales bacterium]|nr:STAS domain-containing protein [Solirubrobacterales bacterium]